MANHLLVHKDLEKGAGILDGVAQFKAVSPNVEGQIAKILGHHVVAALKRRPGPQSLDQMHSCSWRKTQSHGGVGPCALNDTAGQFQNVVGNVDRGQRSPEGKDVGGSHCGRSRYEGCVAGVAEPNSPLGQGFGIPESQFEQKAVELRRRKRKGPIQVEGVLRRDDQEERVDPSRYTTDGYLTFLHDFEEGRLHLGSCPVDFVGQNYLRKDGPRAELEGSRFGVEDIDSRQIVGEKIGRELNSPKVAPGEAGQSLGGRCFSDAWDVFDQDVATGYSR